VPVGADQGQHLEFAREVANGFNHLYGPILPAPDTLLSPARRVMSLTRPVQKMSKSDVDPKSRILITDSYEEIHKKIKAAMTDSIEGVSYDPANRPGVSNLIEIIHHIDEGKAGTCQDLASDMKDWSMRALKERVSDTLEKHIRPIREKYESVVHADPNYLEIVSEEGAQKARVRANATLQLVKEAVGLE
jgi:tryptophanyl-tRNA synthetase